LGFVPAREAMQVARLGLGAAHGAVVVVVGGDGAPGWSGGTLMRMQGGAMPRCEEGATRGRCTCVYGAKRQCGARGGEAVPVSGGGTHIWFGMKCERENSY
jgi:hypothetical protein